MSAWMRSKTNAELESEYVDAFKYFNKAGDGIITSVELDKILAAMGKKRTPVEMDRILFCLDPAHITQSDFLSLMASSLVADTIPRKSLIEDAFKLYNAVKHNKAVTERRFDTLKLTVMDNGLIMREDFKAFLSADGEGFMTPLNVKTQPINVKTKPYRRKYEYDVDMALIPPNIYVEYPVNAEGCFEAHRVCYTEWIKKVKFPTPLRPPRGHLQEMIQAFRLYNLVYGNKEAKIMELGDLQVNDQGLILKKDLRTMMLTLGENLQDHEIGPFMQRAEHFTDRENPEYINYERLCKSRMLILPDRNTSNKMF